MLCFHFIFVELGIHPVRGLLLYGKPGKASPNDPIFVSVVFINIISYMVALLSVTGCGKTLLASTLGSILSPFRPITVVSGPEVLDKFVGSSEKVSQDVFTVLLRSHCLCLLTQNASCFIQSRIEPEKHF